MAMLCTTCSQICLLLVHAAWLAQQHETMLVAAVTQRYPAKAEQLRRVAIKVLGLAHVG